MSPKSRWTFIRQQLWQPSRPHGEQPRERTVGPLELFYDLVMVVLVGQAAHHLAEELTWRGLAEYAVVFTLIWAAWLNGSLHHELHGRDDARARVTFLLQILVLVPLAVVIPEAGGERSGPFAVTAGLLFAILACMWALASRRDSPEFRVLTRLYVIGTGAGAVLLAASALLPQNARLPAWALLGALYLAGLAAALRSTARLGAFAITDAVNERFGLLIIIVLGETVTGVVAGLNEEPVLDARILAVALVAVAVGFGAWWTYFDYAGHRPLQGTRTAPRWLFAHLPLTAAIAAMGAAMASLIEHAHDARTPASTAWLLSATCAAVLVSTMLVATTLRAWHEDRAMYRPLTVTSTGAAAACLALGAARPAPLLLGLGLLVILCVPWGVAVVRRGDAQYTTSSAAH